MTTANGSIYPITWTDAKMWNISENMEIPKTIDCKFKAGW